MLRFGVGVVCVHVVFVRMCVHVVLCVCVYMWCVVLCVVCVHVVCGVGGPDESQHDESILVRAEMHLIKDATEQLQG